MQNTKIPDEYKNIFDALNAGHHTTREYKELSIWPREIPATQTTVKTPEFWLLNDVLGTVKGLDPEPYQNRYTIRCILEQYAPVDMPSHTKLKLPENHTYVISTGENFNAEISPYAAWAIMKEIGERFDTSFQQEYFLTKNPNMMNIFAHVRQNLRIKEREIAKEKYKSLSGILSHDLNATPSYIAAFNTLLLTKLFGGKSIQSIQKEYRISENRPIADYMDIDLITAFSGALARIVSRYNALSKKSYDALYEIAKNEMKSTRKCFIDNNDLPENNICIVSFDDIKQDIQTREQKFIQANINYVRGQLR